jgi:predicted nicotinamide N-methyase
MLSTISPRVAVGCNMLSQQNAREELIRSRLALLTRIQRRYQTLTEPVTIGTLTFDFTRIEDPDRVLDEVAAECDRLEKVTGQRQSDPQHLPYWAELWDSATGIGQFLFKQQDRVAGRRVLDLGCGMGLSGTVAAALDARVLFADIEASALLFAQLNSLPWAMHVRTRQVNWQTDHLEEDFHLILGADILYERSQWPFLEKFWRSHLAPRGRIILGEPGRQTGDDFGGWIGPQGWRITMHEEPVVTRPRPIRLFELERIG